MTNSVKVARCPASPAASDVHAAQRSLGELLTPLDQTAQNSLNITVNRMARFGLKRPTRMSFLRYLFIGPLGGGDAPIRIGIFAGIHGDEPESVYAAVSVSPSAEGLPGIGDRLLHLCFSDLQPNRL